jgi:hypothetical protein
MCRGFFFSTIERHNMKLRVLACIMLLSLTACAAPELNRGVTITIEDGGMRMPTDVGRGMIPCTKDQHCIVAIY